MIHNNRLMLFFIILLLSFIINLPYMTYAIEEKTTISSDTISTNNNSQSKSFSISKNSDTYKILVGLTIFAVIVAIIMLREIIINIFAYTFIIGSICFTIYSALPLITGKGIADYTSIVLGVALIIVSIILFQIINGKTFLNKAEKDKNEYSSKNEFDLIIKRSKLAFLSLKNEISSGKQDKLVAFTGNELYDELNKTLSNMKSENFKVNYDDLIVKEIKIKKKAVENHMNNIYVEIKAWASKYNTDLKTNKIIENSLTKGLFTEILCFSRKAGCKPAIKGLIEGFCPRCGNSIKGKRIDNCEKCKTELRSGEFDIVLTGVSYPEK